MPKRVIFGFAANRPIHVVAAYDTESDITHIITAYEPSLNLFMDDLKTRKNYDSGPLPNLWRLKTARNNNDHSRYG